MAVDIFLKLNKIKGESVDSKYAGEIDVLQWSWGMSQSGTTHLGPGGGSGKVNVQDISITKYVDMATHELLKACASGLHIADGELIVRKAGSVPLEYFRLKMTDIMVSSYQTGGSGDGMDRVMETVTLNFAKYEVTYASQKNDGSKGPEGQAGFDIAKNEAV
ncbi:type VI secretion system tube protein Hcp [Sulfitobacter albidus]|uniref:Type VI secretion system tube protein Hcp n=1 Tax=Sulfitobacter albidus TaxID=2829501 RepID=A0A975PP77_9RHOB|nr:type VI secretion system tube protein Hcp [Sulfitobacter albidus]QUJ78246.1 type VI secretion system tube protein Hcp [Sulfitobacter albidus]